MPISIYSRKDHGWRDRFNPLRGLALSRLVSLLEAGGLLTMLSEAGSGTLAGNAHRDTFMQIARSDAITLSGVLQRDIDLPLMEAFFPGKPVLAYFEFSPGTAEETSQVVEDAVRLAQAGYWMDARELSEKTGYQLTVGSRQWAGGSWQLAVGSG